MFKHINQSYLGGLITPISQCEKLSANEILRKFTYPFLEDGVEKKKYNEILEREDEKKGQHRWCNLYHILKSSTNVGSTIYHITENCKNRNSGN